MKLLSEAQINASIHIWVTWASTGTGLK